jgi:hypothetical protein
MQRANLFSNYLLNILYFVIPVLGIIFNIFYLVDCEVGVSFYSTFSVYVLVSSG